ncbi:unnamed protein product [Linum trigynum]|uniref:TF-B3 domain-containing protein n=1 Tax=Linum trigynum TaxID=586398 RepID=A0AAV2G1Y2_9ROSI
MASSGHRLGRKDDPNLAERIDASFLKIILQTTVRDRKLLIPRKFVTDSVGGLLKWKSATLKVNDGVEWEVGLAREGKQDVCFGNHGWARFAQYYSLEYGHSLVFKYLGRSTFFVIIFDRSTMEMDYPVREDVGIKEDGGGGGGEVDAAAATTTNQLKRNKGKGKGESSKMVRQEEEQGSKGEAPSGNPSSSSSRKRRAH